jgi:hypothetical protein
MKRLLGRRRFQSAEFQVAKTFWEDGSKVETLKH